MRMVLSLFVLAIATGSAIADIAPSPTRRNRPYLDALKAKGLACAGIAERTEVENAPEAKANEKYFVYSVSCEGGPRYRMVVERLPRSGRRSRVDNIRLIQARRM